MFGRFKSTENAFHFDYYDFDSTIVIYDRNICILPIPLLAKRRVAAIHLNIFSCSSKRSIRGSF